MLTGEAEMELDGRKSKKTNIGYLMDPDVALNRRNVYVGATGGSYTSKLAQNDSSRSNYQQESQRTARLEMSERRMLDQ